LVDAAIGADTVIDVTAGPALFGGFLRGRDDLTLMVQAPLIASRATDEAHATDLIQAHLIETLSSIGREWIDFYVMPVPAAMEEFQANGALAALESARQDGHIRFLGLGVTGHPLAALGFLQFHDGFDIAVVPNSTDTVSVIGAIASQRRVGMVYRDSDAHGLPALLTVRTPEEVGFALGRSVGVA
jgi:aryl-alcohol dehydrogenase-like predicted oxidoreductase